MKIGDIVEINGINRIITRIDGDKFFSTPCGNIEKPTIEEIKVPKKRRGKKNGDMA